MQAGDFVRKDGSRGTMNNRTMEINAAIASISPSPAMDDVYLHSMTTRTHEPAKGPMN